MKINKWKRLKKITNLTLISLLLLMTLLHLLPGSGAHAETLSGSASIVNTGMFEGDMATSIHTIMDFRPTFGYGYFHADRWNKPPMFVGDYQTGPSFAPTTVSVFEGPASFWMVQRFALGILTPVSGTREQEMRWEMEQATGASTANPLNLSYLYLDNRANHPSQEAMHNLTGGEVQYWGDAFVTSQPAVKGEINSWRRMYLDRSTVAAAEFDPSGTVNYLVWSGYYVEPVDGEWREWMLYDLMDDNDQLIATVPLFYWNHNRQRIYPAQGIDIPSEIDTMHGVSPTVNGLAPNPPMQSEGRNSAELEPIAPFERKVEMLNTIVGSNLSYDVVGAVTGTSLTLGDTGEPYTYKQSFVPVDHINDLITDGKYSGIGTGTLRVTITDYENDETIFEQPVVVKTDQKPTINIYYGAGAQDLNEGVLAPNTPYDALAATLPAGGEEGWSNQPLQVVVSPAPITGHFDTVLTMPDSTGGTQTGDSVTSTADYITNTPYVGVDVTGVLTEIGIPTNPLSEPAFATMKIDTVPPTADAEYDEDAGGLTFNDTSKDNEHHSEAPEGSGISTATPSRIAIVPANSPEPSLGEFVLFEDTPSVLAFGEYDVWVWTRDKAGNTDVQRAIDGLVLGSKVEISKDTDEGATLHSIECTLDLSLDAVGCDDSCEGGNGVDIEELSDITYNLYIENSDPTHLASGTFEDYLPLGVEMSLGNPPTFTPAGSVSDLEYERNEIAGDPNEGRWKVSGSYADLASGTRIEIKIPGTVPAFDKGVGATNIFRNQATLTWEYEEASGGTVIGTSESNFALHRATAIPTVETQFTKVGADALTTGLGGAEFVLYRLDDETISAVGDIVDPYVLEDKGWRRVKLDGEDAELNDVFVATGSGEVNLGALPTGVYTLIETKAPAGYELPVGQWILTINHLNDDSGDADDWKIEFVGKSDSIMPPAAVRDISGGAPAYSIINARPFSIGVSGLRGTRGLLLVGFALMALAGNAYIVYRQREKSK